MIADPLWSCVMLLCGPLWVFCGSFVVFAVFCGSFAVLCGSLRYLVIPYVSCRCARAAGSTCTIEPQSTTVDSPSSHKSQTRAWISSSKRLSHCLTRKLFRQNRLSTELDLCTRTNQRESWRQLQFVNYATSWSDGKVQTVLNATQLSVDIYHFHYTDYHSVNVKCNNIVKICSLASENETLKTINSCVELPVQKST